jgi:hypothetical protein
MSNQKCVVCSGETFNVNEKNEVFCSACNVSLPLGSPVAAPRASGVYEMPFGKHKGKALGDVPREYLVWLEKNFDDGPCKDEVRAYLAKGVAQ